MKFRQLEAFNHVMSSGSMVAAAKIMHISQPAISRLISDLETDIKFKLFNRKQGTLTPTENGLAFYEVVGENFIGMQRLENAAKHIQEAGSQVLRLAVTHSLAATLLPPVLKIFTTQFPDVKVLLHSHRLSQIVLRLQNASVDIAVGAQLPKVSGCNRELIGHAQQVCVLPVHHPLATHSTIRPEDLSGESILRIMPDGPADWSEIFSVLENKNIPFNDSVEVDTSVTAYALIAQGLAIGIVEPFSARFWPKEEVTTRTFEPGLHTAYYISSQNRRGLSLEQEKFINILRNVAEKMPEFSDINTNINRG